MCKDVQTINYPNGDVYVGEVKDGKPNGKGTLWQDGDLLLYEGDWQNGLYHGKGKLFISGEGIYEGDFAGGKRHGKGRFEEFCSCSYYDGDWADDMRHGYGVQFVDMSLAMRDKDDYYLEGEWVNGEKHGEFLFYFDPDGKKYKELWENGICKKSANFDD